MTTAALYCNRSSNRSVIDQLNSDWVTNHQTHRRPPAWQHDPPLTGRTPAQIVDDAHDQQQRESTEQVLTVRVAGPAPTTWPPSPPYTSSCRPPKLSWPAPTPPASQNHATPTRAW